MSPTCTLYRLILLLMIMCLSACAHTIESPAQRLSRTELLTQKILALSPIITVQEARDFASTAVETSVQLGLKYGVSLSPWLHNASIHIGLKERGFCYQYMEDLYASLKTVKNENLAMYFIAAKRGEIGEHHALTVIAKNSPWNSGIVLDAWRANGTLYFGSLQEDHYPWVSDTQAYFVRSSVK
jgi:hypothetical protein